MRNKINKIIGKLIIYLSRKDYSPEKIKKFQVKFLYIFLPIFFITTFNYSTSIKGALFGISISTNIPFMFINGFILIFSTLVIYLYNANIYNIRTDYVYKLFKEQDQIVCAYFDKNFGDTVYKIKKKGYNDYFYIHMINGDKYYFDDWVAFKFVGVKESRRLKLEQLKNYEMDL